MHLLPGRLLTLLRTQSGVVSRRQVIAMGQHPDDIRRWRRQRLLTVMHPGVYLDHTGRPSWQQRAWAAVLYAEPAVLYGSSAFRVVAGPGLRGHDDGGPIHVAVDHLRTVSSPPGVLVHRVRDLDRLALWQLSPPRMRLEDAVLDVAAAAPDDYAAVSVIARAIGGLLTTADRLASALQHRGRITRRRLLAGVLDDAATGACSVLEREYLHRVERAHGLPAGARQQPGRRLGPTGGRVYRDVNYRRYGLLVELDGRLDHSDATDVDADLDRDLDAAVERLRTIRLGWGQVVGRPCHTAARLARLLRSLGWEGTMTRCPACPT